MENIKDIVEMVKYDRVVLQEMRRIVGSQGDPGEVRKMQARLKYEDAEEKLVALKRVNLGSDLDKILRVQKEIDTIRKTDVQVCQYLMDVDRIPKIVKVKKEKVKKEKKYLIDHSKWPEEFSCIGGERIPIVVSKDRVVDLVKMPHLLVAGSTGSGKSVFLNVAILSILKKLKPEECKLALIDPKRVEFSLYRDVPHLYTPVATELDEVEELLSKLVDEMERRYEELRRVDVKSLEAYNKQEKEKMPYIVVVIDEMADLMMTSGGGVSEKIIRLAQLARAAGIHMIMATQRPVVEIMTGLIKANMPARISFRVESKQDSRIILDEGGAEVLNGAGEMIFKNNGKFEKHQGIYVTDEQIKKICGR